MLALTRFVGEEIVIGDPKAPLGTIRVVALMPGKVRLSFKDFDGITIHRQEVAVAIRKGIPQKGTADEPR